MISALLGQGSLPQVQQVAVPRQELRDPVDVVGLVDVGALEVVEPGKFRQLFSSPSFLLLSWRTLVFSRCAKKPARRGMLKPAVESERASGPYRDFAPAWMAVVRAGCAIMHLMAAMYACFSAVASVRLAWCGLLVLAARSNARSGGEGTLW